MPDLLYERLSRLAGHARTFDSLARGIEKESLRMTADGYLSTEPHPVCLGSALTNSQITTDYSEALVELVTPVTRSARHVHAHLTDLHAFLQDCLGKELLWTQSMPCIVPRDDTIPVAEYGTSNVGMMKHVYRLGLGYRYGRVMQTIAGLHYNVSMPKAFWEINREHRVMQGEDPSADQSSHYFGMVRNVHRNCWLLLYMLGASPAICKSFVAGRDHGLEELDSGTVYSPYATSLRMSRLGYQNNAQDGLDIRYNNLLEYANSLEAATQTPHGPYEDIGVKKGDTWRQLNANILQIENEYYAVVRPKRVALSGEKPSNALRERGVEYVELRAIDLDPFEAAGISLDAIRFLDVFSLYCMLDESPEVSTEDQQRFSENQSRTVMAGRAPDTRVHYRGDEPLLSEAAIDILDRMADVAGFLDDASGGRAHADAIAVMRARALDPTLTPSARVLSEMQSRGERFSDFGLRMSKEHQASLLERGLAPAVRAELEQSARQSLDDQRRIEAEDKVSFDTYLNAYMSGNV